MAKVFVEDNEEIDIICNAITSAYKEVTEFGIQNEAIKNRLKTLIATINEGLHILPRTMISFINFDFAALSNNYAKDFKKIKFDPDHQKVIEIYNKSLENVGALEKIAETLSNLAKKRVEKNNGIDENCGGFGFIQIENLVGMDKVLLEEIRKMKASMHQLQEFFQASMKGTESEECEIYRLIRDEL